MKKILVYLVSLLLVFKVFVKSSYGQDKQIPQEYYVASTIPDSLKENANSVVRYAIEEDEVLGPGKMIEKHHEIVTILHEKGDNEAVMAMGYSTKYDSFSDVIMRVFDQTGKLLKKYRKSDMYDGLDIDYETLVTDYRFLAVKHTVANYPTTVEIEYERNTSNIMDLGEWRIQKKEQAVQHSYFHVVIDENAGFRYLNKNIKVEPKKTTVNGKSDYFWEVANLKAFKMEGGAPAWKTLPAVYFAQNKFVWYGYPGDLSSWQSYGQWQKDLNADVYSLDPAREAEIRKMTDTIKTDKEKAKFLYKYLQQSVRYVSIQLGIGGWKPFPATFVDKKKYGDCKALSNYMGALLKAVGIPSYYAIINAEANKEPAEPSFPFDYFNHVIRCIPFKGDTTWLECTSNTNEFGVLGTFTENRNALIITEDGGKLVRTPKSTMNENQFNSEAHIVLTADGGATAKIKISCTGEYRFHYINYSYLKTDEQKERYMRTLNIRQPSVFDLKPSVDKGGVDEINMNLEYDKFSDIIAGNKQFYRPRVFDLSAFSVPAEENRKTDYYFEHPFTRSCVTTIDLPAGFEVETLPANQSLKFTYGNYEVKYAYDPAKNQVVGTANFNLTNHVIPAAKYTEMQQYFDAVAKAQNKKLVIRRKA